MTTGSCLCGAVRFAIDIELRPAVACHCSQCRKQSGHFWVSTEVERDRLTIEGEDQLTWYRASAKVRRGFCKVCGSFLFWEPLRGKRVAVAMGALDSPTETQLAQHIFTADKGDYYEIHDGLPQNRQ
ncbi:MAG: GFA family protein [Myxococcota bacterium]